ncbi:unnamed protein product [Mucor hiemalis]
MSVKIVIAHHPYEAQREDEISFAKDEVIKVTDFSDPDWWVGKKKDGSLGFFPSNFVSEKDEESTESTTDITEVDKENIPPPTTATDVAQEETPAPTEDESIEAAEDKPPVEEKKDQVIGMARVMEHYAMQENGELTLHRGGIVNVYEVIDNEWSRGELNGKVGKYPHKYVEDIDMPGRPDLGKQSSTSSESQPQQNQTEDDAPKGGFKLAAFGVKQGGIGSLLAGGFPGLKKAGGAKPSPPVAAPEPKVTEPEPKAAEVSEPDEPKVESKPVEVEQETPVEQKQQPEEPPKQKSLGKAIVLHPYDAESEDELSLLRGEYVEILDRNIDDGWWKGLNERGQSGVFPNNFVREIDEESIVAPPTPTRARRSIQSVNSTGSSAVSPTAPAVPGNRPPSINNATMAKPPQVPRPSSVQAPATARPISVQPPSQRPSSISHTNSSSLATPPKIAASAATAAISHQQVTSPTIEEEEAKDAEEEDDLSSPVESVEKVQSPVPSLPTQQQPSPVERKPSSTSQDSVDVQPIEREIPSSLREEAIKSPPVVPEDPISDKEEKESSAEEIVSPVIAAAAPVAAVSRDIVEEKEEPKHDVEVTENNKEEEEPIISHESPVVDEEKKDEEDKKPEEEVKNEEKEVEKEDDFKDAKGTEEEEKPVEEEKNELDIIASGPKLTTPSRARIGGGRARRSPSSNSTAQEPSQTELLQKEVLEEEEKPREAQEEEAKKDSPSPPAKPVKPIFAKFPTPFAGAGISKTHLKPTQTRKLWDDKPEEKAPTVADEDVQQPVKPSGVKNIASRFNFAGNTSSGSNDVLETKLKNHTKNEVEKVRKEFEHLLSEEREKRLALESIVQELLEKVKSLEQ